LFATGDSMTRAQLVPCAPRALRLDEACVDPLAHHVLMIEEVVRRAADFDLVHFHATYLHFPIMGRLGIPHVTTVHGPLDVPDLLPLHRAFSEEPLVSISDAQRAPFSFANWQGTVYNGVPPSSLSFRASPGQYLAFLGRISPEKAPDVAIEIAKRAGMPLKIAAKVDKVDMEFFQGPLPPPPYHPLTHFLGS